MANERARALRKNTTDAEKKLWRALRGKQLSGYRFRRQHPLGPYIVDFICLERKLVVELDGGQHGEDAQMAHDLRRDAWLEERGFHVLRFWNGELSERYEGVLADIDLMLRAPLD